MIEIIVKRHIENTIDIPVYVGEKPVKKPNEYVVIRTIDSGRINMIDAVTINLESYSTTLQKAAELNKKVKEAMFNAIELPEISSSKIGGGGQNIDTATKTYCYESVFNLYYTI